MVSRINRLRIFPEMCARTRCLLARATRNMVPGRTDMIVPSNSRAFSLFIIEIKPAPRFSKPAATIDFGSTDDCRRMSVCRRRRMGEDALHADALRSHLGGGRLALCR